MARISTYSLDTNVDPADKLLGTSSEGGTKNFQISDIAQFLGSTNASGIAGSVPFKYNPSTLANGSMQIVGGATAFPTSANVVLRVSKFPNGQNKTALAVLNTFPTKDIIISQVQDSNVFAVYRVKSVQQVGSSDFYDVTMDHLQSNNDSEGNGFLANVFYVLTPYIGAQDKDFSLSFSTSDLVSDSGEFHLVVNHNLGKFPNITVKVSTGSIVHVPIKHITNNQSKVFFKSLNSGVIHAN